ncbi:DNA-binding response regulator, NarL/FixJ family, contains REC and HTH domains [Polaribacter sp. KT25b]|uniref:response regulator transcription factor n=1 Tax=Polaribacter sp. KT25b TaxID=1855336 RepID=UPI00087A5531|nr:response regulator transcription factor [Polaribacter sp. KT25b]SDS53457.1 DNA-binding response regulator, NarL/FixJ family, contains REC and HTH domains [Polaribacter sp. KT25b]
MKNKIRVLLVDDHPLLLKGLVLTFDEIKDFTFDIVYKTSCDSAYEAVLLSEKTNPFDILLTGLSFSLNDGNIVSGEELINQLKKVAPNLKIGVITGHSETNRIFNVIKNQQPLVYLLKDDCNATELNFAIHKMLKNQNYYSHLVHQKILKRSIVQISMDSIAIQILEELPKHAKINNLVGHIKREDGKLLKIRSIEMKLADLRIDLNAKNNTDLVLKAKELGIID